jgi:aminoglycoside N3'-acetyltransferase
MVINKIIEDLNLMGINKGDIVFIRADLGKINIPVLKKNDYLDSIMDAVGPEGTIVGLSFTEYSFLFKNKALIFNGKNKAITGSFANLMLSHPLAVRSKHPTNSYVAIGKHAKFITEGHDETSGAFDPIKKIIELDAKMLLIGCVGSNPGFTTTHLVETELGLDKKFILQGRASVYYEKDGTVNLFTRNDIGCCSNAHHKMYGHYIKDETLSQGYIGSAYSITIDAKRSYEIEKKVLSNNSKYLLCCDEDCIKCNLRWDTLNKVPGYLFRNFSKFLRKRYKN